MKKTIYANLAMLLMANYAMADTKANPNIILIVVDDMGYSDFGCYGNTNNYTPNIDKLANEGMKFTDFHTNGSVSSPTRAALLTGRYQEECGITGVVTAASHRDKGLDPTVNTIARLLKSKNYNTGMIGKWHLGYDVKFNPTNYGFDDFIGYVSGNVDYITHIDQAGYKDWWHNKKLKNEEGYTSYLITSHAEKFIKKESKEKDPFFLYIPYEACHGPYQGPNDPIVRSYKDGKFVVNEVKDKAKNFSSYKDMVETLDVCIGKIMQSLKDANIDENTLVFFFSDNGGAKYSSNKPFSGFKGSLLEGGHRVSSIVRWPAVVPQNSVCNETVMTMDIMPTLCEINNIPQSDYVTDGVSILNTLKHSTQLDKRFLFWEFNNSMCVRFGDMKLIVNKKTNKGTLVNLSKDIAEKNNLWNTYPEIRELLLKKLNEWYHSYDKVKKLS